MGSSQGRADNGATSAAASSSTSEDQPSPRSRMYDPHDNSSFMSGWLMLRPPGKRKARAMWCLVKDGMMHEFKRAESRKPHASRPLEGSLAMPFEDRKEGNSRKAGFQLVLGGLYGSQQQETIEYELVGGCDDDVERWLNSISAASLLAAIASNGCMPRYAVEALAVSEEKTLRRERRSRAVAGKATPSWDGCSVASSALSTASTVSVASVSSRRSLSPLKSASLPVAASRASSPSPTPAVKPDTPPRSVDLSDSLLEGADNPPLPQPVSAPSPSARHFMRRAPSSLRRSLAAAPEVQHAPATNCARAMQRVTRDGAEEGVIDV
jgi:hypothetical protein